MITTACARLSEAKAGLTGSVMMRSASATSSFSSPLRSRPNRMRDVARRAATCGGHQARRLVRRRPRAWPDRARARWSRAPRCSRRSPPPRCRRARRASRMRSAPAAITLRLGVRPALPRLDQAQPRQPEIAPWRAPPRRYSRRAAARPGSRSVPARRPSSWSCRCRRPAFAITDSKLRRIRFNRRIAGRGRRLRSVTNFAQAE